MTVHIVTDSTSDLSADEAARLGVTVVPLQLRFGEETFADGVDIDAQTFYARLRRGDHPVSSQPTPAAFEAAYAGLLTDPDDKVLSIHLASKWSGTLQSASLAAQAFEGRIACVDSGSISSGIQFLVHAAVREAAAGAELEDLRRAAEESARRVFIFVMMDSLVWLQRGGRIGRAQAFVGGILNVKPILRLVDGEAHPQARVRNRQQGVTRLMALMAEQGPLEGVGLMTSGETQEAGDAEQAVRAAYPELEVQRGWLGPVVGVYAGPDAIGIAGLRAPSAEDAIKA